jgi:hypothetical protein
MMQCNLGSRPFERVGLALPSIAESLVLAARIPEHGCPMPGRLNLPRLSLSECRTMRVS